MQEDAIMGALCGCLTWREAHALVLGMARIALILYGALFTGRNVEHFFAAFICPVHTL